MPPVARRQVVMPKASRLRHATMRRPGRCRGTPYRSVHRPGIYATAVHTHREPRRCHGRADIADRRRGRQAAGHSRSLCCCYATAAPGGDGIERAVAGSARQPYVRSRGMPAAASSAPRHAAARAAARAHAEPAPDKGQRQLMFASEAQKATRHAASNVTVVEAEQSFGRVLPVCSGAFVERRGAQPPRHLHHAVQPQPWHSERYARTDVGAG